MVNRHGADIAALDETAPAKYGFVPAFDRPFGDAEGLDFGIDVLEGTRCGIPVRSS